MAPSEFPARRIARAKAPEPTLSLLRNWSERLEKNAAGGTDLWMITAFIRATRRAYDHLREACERDSCYASWACFMLLELRILAKYFAQSPQIRSAFRHTMFHELDDFLAVQRAVASDLLPEVLPVAENLAGELRKHRPNGNSAGYKRPATSRLAVELGFAQEYKRMKKLTLVWAYPTALSVLSMESALTRQTIQELLFQAGGKYVGEILEDLIPLAHEMITEAGGKSLLM